MVDVKELIEKVRCEGSEHLEGYAESIDAIRQAYEVGYWHGRAEGQYFDENGFTKYEERLLPFDAFLRHMSAEMKYHLENAFDEGLKILLEKIEDEEKAE